MQQIVLASHNPHKQQEIMQLLQGIAIEPVSQSYFGLESCEEPATTFVENALLKARHACQHTELPALADDSGIIVDALKGVPGVYSARFAGEQATDADNNVKLLQQLNNIASLRSARYHCVLVFLRWVDDPQPIICEGSWEGEILTAPQGAAGFGYDPLFYLPQLGCSAAELTADQKQQYSHRGQAMRQLRQQLRKVYGTTKL